MMTLYMQYKANGSLLSLIELPVLTFTFENSAMIFEYLKDLLGREIEE
jgi:hypothetical protein